MAEGRHPALMRGGPGARWPDGELVFAAYNEAIPYGQLIVVREGTLLLYRAEGPAGDFIAARPPEEEE